MNLEQTEVKKITKAVFKEEIAEILNDKNIDLPFDMLGFHTVGSLSKWLSDTVIEFYLGELTQGKVIYLKNVGKLYSIKKEAGRPVRNPKTGEEMRMKETVSFKFSKGMTTKSISSEKVLPRHFCEFMETLGFNEVIAKKVYAVFTGFFDSVLNDNARIEFRGMGSFYRKTLQARKARNPKTGERIFKEARNKICFRAGRPLLIASKELHLH